MTAKVRMLTFDRTVRTTVENFCKTCGASFVARQNRKLAPYQDDAVDTGERKIFELEKVLPSERQ